MVQATHGGNLDATARRLGCRPEQLLDASASLVPFAWPGYLRRALRQAACRPYPDREAFGLRSRLAAVHGVDPLAVLPGNGASELFTWAARDATDLGVSILPQPGFADYKRALRCWGGRWSARPLPLHWSLARSGFDSAVSAGDADVLWITNPHNPTGQLWDRASLQPLLQRFALVICDEAFLPLVPEGDQQSLIPWVENYPNLIVIRSLTKLYSIAGLRLGYAIADPARLQRWSQWRDPWPVNAIAAAVGEELVREPRRYQAWIQRVQRWTSQEGAWLQRQLASLPGINPMPSAANYVLIRGECNGEPCSLQPLREVLEVQRRILLRDCRSFDELDESWLRMGYQSHRDNRRILHAMRQS